MVDHSEIQGRFSTYIARRIPDGEDIRLEDFSRIHGGASRETYRMDVTYGLDGKEVSKGLILRLAVADSLLETDPSGEFHAIDAFYPTDIPVPRPLWHEADSSLLGTPFLVMEEIPGCESAVEALLAPPYAAVREAIGLNFCRIMGLIAKTDPDAVGLSELLKKPAPDECWRRELDYWKGIIDRDALEPQPVAAAAIRWLYRNPPSPAQKVGVVHGDYRIGNILYDAAGTIHAVLDWEQCHLGDPLEDLAYALNPLWSVPEPNRLGLMIPREEAVPLWEQASGLKVLPNDLHWWEIFAMVKSMGIWLSASRVYSDGRNMDPMMAYAGWSAGDIQNYLIVSAMGKAA